ncbi:CheB methylesterase domain-containing protein [Pseudogemmobacter sonorensis]|uniref:CheB methylesterase domain-containing protein n=1 Tax=Pseudogemmobacter sonorensis TaxID=2989681 RepID=UPI0036AACD66
MILLGASTGGIAALETVLAVFPPDCPPTMIVQHIRDGFAESMIRRFHQDLAPRVEAARDGQALQRGTILIARDGAHHLALSHGVGGLRARLLPGDPVSGHRPSADILFQHGAAVAGRITIRAALLTGMGVNGAEGLAALRAAGAHAIAQDQANSVTWGMPPAVVERGAAVEVLPVDRIGRALLAGTDAGVTPARRGPP